MKKILVAYDGTPGAELAVQDMVRGGFPERAEAHILSIADVWLPQPPAQGDSPEAEAFATAREHAQAAVREAEKTAIAGAQLVHSLFPEWQITNAAAADSPAWGIAAESKRWGADLIVIGSHGRNPLERFFLGSVSHKVAAEAECSVRIARGRKSQDHYPVHLVVGLDGSDDGRRAVETVLNRRWGSRTEVHLITVMDAKLSSSILGNAAAPPIARVEDWAEPLFREMRERFAAKEIQVHSHLLDGDPKSALLRQAEKVDADCIFLGARGLEHGNRLYLGTVASAICTRARCTVEVIRSRAVQ